VACAPQLGVYIATPWVFHSGRSMMYCYLMLSAHWLTILSDAVRVPRSRGLLIMVLSAILLLSWVLLLELRLAPDVDYGKRVWHGARSRRVRGCGSG
jgi:hypothetical protein